MTGRPTIFTQELADTICDRLVNGESMREICRDEAMPGSSTIYRWLGSDEHIAFREQYARACEWRGEALADEIIDIADNAANDWMNRQNKDGTLEEVLNHEHVQRSRLRVDARKWAAAKLHPKKYGDLLKLGGDERAPLTVTLQPLDDRL